MEIPSSLDWIRTAPGGPEWLRDLPRKWNLLLETWDLEPDGSAFLGGNVSYVAPVRRGGEKLVLKCQFPDSESEHEAEALNAWNGDGAIRLVAHDPGCHALLVERCLPGEALGDTDCSNPAGVMADLIRRLSVPASGPFNTLADEAVDWAQGLEDQWEGAGRPCEHCLVDAALDYLRSLPFAETLPVLLHQDLHGHNVLSAKRAPWLAIDPKPLAGDPAFAPSPVVRSFELGHTKDETLYRLDCLSSELALDRRRVRGWCIARTMAWSFGGAFDAYHHQTVRWLLEM